MQALRLAWEQHPGTTVGYMFPVAANFSMLNISHNHRETTNHAKVFEDRGHPGDWYVDDGYHPLSLFSGPHAHVRALDYARVMFDEFDEISPRTRERVAVEP
jgi:hypothetical protein